jgi:hypothetical protein
VADEGGEFLRAPIGHPALEVVSKDRRATSALPPTPQPRPVQPAQRQRAGTSLSTLACQLLARKAKTSALMKENHRLREEVSRVAARCAEARAQAEFALAYARRVGWAIDQDYGTRKRVVGGNSGA